MGLFISETGKVQAFPDGLVIATERIEVLDRINNALQQLEETRTPTWVVQSYILSLTDTQKTSLGFSLDQTVKVSAAVSSSSESAKAASGQFSALLQAAEDFGTGSLVASPLLLIRDGSTGRLQNGTRTPVALYSTSPYGVTSITGYNYVDSGLTASLEVREDSTTSCRMVYTYQFADAVTAPNALAGAPPTLITQSLTGDATISSGGVYLLGSLEMSQKNHTLSGSIVPSVWSTDDTTRTIQIWCRAYRVGAMAPAPASSGPVTTAATRIDEPGSPRSGVARSDEDARITIEPVP
jgi:type II secretory pathway component GspD/PulD (secretin)